MLVWSQGAGGSGELRVQRAGAAGHDQRTIHPGGRQLPAPTGRQGGLLRVPQEQVWHGAGGNAGKRF